MAASVLYTYPNNFRAFKVLIAAKFSNTNVTVSESFKFGETNTSEEFTTKFPLGKVPALDDNGFCLFESNAIANYVSSEQLIGASKQDRALVQQWIYFSENEIIPSACAWVYPLLGATQFNKQECDKAKSQVTKALTVLDQHLSTCTYLVGERISLADITMMCNLLLPYEHVFEPEFIKPFRNVNRWFTTMINQPQVKTVIPSFTFCTKAAKFDPAKYAEVHGIQKKEKKPTKKEATPKKEEKKEDKKAAEKDDDDEPSATEIEAKQSKDPLGDLPKGTFIMDEFKRTYCNENTDTVAIPYLWEHFDSEHYSIWLAEYNYNDDLSLLFMTKNLVGGMFQRLDKLNKNAFAAVCVFGENKKNSIAGIWIWKGLELVFPLSVNWTVDYESYTWTKLDHTKPENKKLIEEYLRGEDEIDGKPLAHHLLFK